MLFTVSVIVIACPCALGLATPTALIVGTARSAIDKTGTITVGKPEVTDIVGNKKQVLRIAASLEESSEHPLATAIVKKADSEKLQIEKVSDFEAIKGKGVKANHHDQTVFVESNRLLADVNISQEMNQQATKLQEEAKTVVYVDLNGEIIGLIAIQDISKPSSKSAISEPKKRGLKTVMLTGNNEKVAQAIANEVRIDQVLLVFYQTKKLSIFKNFNNMATR